jgi:hypothetical protein
VRIIANSECEWNGYETCSRGPVYDTTATGAGLKDVSKITSVPSRVI